jgi:hypothetical protein
MTYYSNTGAKGAEWYPHLSEAGRKYINKNLGKPGFAKPIKILIDNAMVERKRVLEAREEAKKRGPLDEQGRQISVKSEPMDIAFQLLKERKSPEAFANKKKYDSEYQKTPKRVKYREQLNAERRRRGIYGKGGKDVSHTQGGKLTLESVHANRARHFKNKGTLRRVK